MTRLPASAQVGSARARFPASAIRSLAIAGDLRNWATFPGGPAWDGKSFIAPDARTTLRLSQRRLGRRTPYRTTQRVYQRLQ
ncbi:MAG: hypothetical protein RLN70_12035, partial [Rhodospirillaceae bacterium]